MYTLFIYNSESKRLERYRLEPYSAVPYACRFSLTASDFFANTVSSAGWTSTEFILKWNKLSRGRLHPKSAFRRIWEGGYISESMHYAGLAADAEDIPEDHGFPFRENNHVAMQRFGYPDLSFGDLGLFVLVMQDALSSLGFCEGELDGFFGPCTLRALTRFRRMYGLPDGNTCDRRTWKELTFRACGVGASGTCKYVFKNKIIL